MKYYCFKQTYKNIKKPYYSLRFNQSNTLKLINLIKPYIHPTMIYKIGLEEDYKENLYSWDYNFLDYGYAKISKIEERINTGYMIKKGADINARTSSGFLAETALDRAMITSAIVDLIRKHGGKTAVELEAEKK